MTQKDRLPIDWNEPIDLGFGVLPGGKSAEAVIEQQLDAALDEAIEQLDPDWKDLRNHVRTATQKVISKQANDISRLDSRKKEDVWYYAHEGASVGPISHEILQSLILARELTSESLVWSTSLQDWTMVSSAGFDLPTDSARPGPPPPTITCEICGATIPDGSLYCETCTAATVHPPRVKIEVPAIDSVACIHCGELLTKTAKFCTACGVPVSKPESSERVCPRCGTSGDNRAKFCTGCGCKFGALPVQETAAVPCTGCGTLILKNQKFCTGCGKPVAR